MYDIPEYDFRLRALKIKQVLNVISHPQWAPEGTKLLVFEDARFEPIKVFPEWVAGHGPQAGGYYVVLSDKRTLFLSELAFDEATLTYAEVAGSGSERWEHHGWTEAGDGLDYPGDVAGQSSGVNPSAAPVALPTQAEADAIAAQAAKEKR